ncbi:type II toxin-antitoxin system RelE/ParE family toxin, partial [Escherichia coli]
LDTATSINDLDLPGLDLHSYAEYTPTRWSLKVSANYRIFFEWDGANVRNVDYDDPH